MDKFIENIILIFFQLLLIWKTEMHFKENESSKSLLFLLCVAIRCEPNKINILYIYISDSIDFFHTCKTFI